MSEPAQRYKKDGWEGAYGDDKVLSGDGWFKKYADVSDDGKARCIDNRWIERFWWTIKQEYIYLSPCDTGGELVEGIRKYIAYYNTTRCHQSLDHKTPFMWYKKEWKAA